MTLEKKSFNSSLIQSALLLLALLLGILKDYVWMVFRSGTGEMIVRKYSFMSATIWGYGLFFPLFFVLLTVILIFFSISQLFISTAKNKRKLLIILGCIDVIFIVLPVILGMQIFNIGIACMSILLIGSLLINFLPFKIK